MKKIIKWFTKIIKKENPNEKHESQFMFEIVDGKLECLWHVCTAAHLEKETVDGEFVFRHSGITLSLLGNQPELDIPEGQTATLDVLDRVTAEGGGVRFGQFASIKIY